MVVRINSVSAVNDRGELLSTASVRTNMVDVAEQVAIAIAMLDPKRLIIYTDSGVVVRTFASGLVAKAAALLKKKSETDSIHHITWFPAHMGDVLPGRLNPNEIAHLRARELACRDGGGTSASSETIGHSDPLLTFHEITARDKGERRHFPPPHPKLSRALSRTLRMLQTGSYPSRGFLSRLHTEIDPHCLDCGEEFCTLAHKLWQCPVLHDFNNSEDWEKAITSTKQEDQSKAVQRAHERAESHGLPAPTWD